MARDGDGDGFVHDGTPRMRPVGPGDLVDAPAATSGDPDLPGVIRWVDGGEFRGRIPVFDADSEVGKRLAELVEEFSGYSASEFLRLMRDARRESTVDPGPATQLWEDFAWTHEDNRRWLSRTARDGAKGPDLVLLQAIRHNWLSRFPDPTTKVRVSRSVDGEASSVDPFAPNAAWKADADDPEAPGTRLTSWTWEPEDELSGGPPELTIAGKRRQTWDGDVAIADVLGAFGDMADEGEVIVGPPGLVDHLLAGKPSGAFAPAVTAAVDGDGDGFVYDGTPRQRPVIPGVDTTWVDPSARKLTTGADVGSPEPSTVRVGDSADTERVPEGFKAKGPTKVEVLDGRLDRTGHYDPDPMLGQPHIVADIDRPERTKQVKFACFRCGGEGGRRGWPGFTCFRCAGTGDEKQHHPWAFPRDWSKQDAADFITGQEAAEEAKRQAEWAAKVEAERAQFRANAAKYPVLNDIEAARQESARYAAMPYVEVEGEPRPPYHHLPERFQKVVEGSARTKNLNVLQVKALADAWETAQDTAAAERAERARATSTSWIGEVGDTHVGDMTVSKVIPVQGRYGPSLLVGFLDDDGNEAVTFTTAAWASKASTGDRVQVTGDIDAHDERNGVPQTKLKRVKVAPATTLAPEPGGDDDITYYEVGGAVRDDLMELFSDDVDFAVTAPSYEAMVAHLEAEGFTIFQEKPEFATVKAKVPDGHPLLARTQVADFVMARRDGPSSDGRRPDYTEPGTLEDDLARRDFTVNAIARDIDGNLIDPHGGQEDIASGTLRFVGEPMDRVNEDGLRVLRGFRFMVTKGLTAEPATWAALTSPLAAERLASIPNNRVAGELQKMLDHDTPASIELLGSLPDETLAAIFKDGMRLAPNQKKLKGKAASQPGSPDVDVDVDPERIPPGFGLPPSVDVIAERDEQDEDRFRHPTRFGRIFIDGRAFYRGDVGEGEAPSNEAVDRLLAAGWVPAETAVRRNRVRNIDTDRLQRRHAYLAGLLEDEDYDFPGARLGFAMRMAELSAIENELEGRGVDVERRTVRPDLPGDLGGPSEPPGPRRDTERAWGDMGVGWEPPDPQDVAAAFSVDLGDGYSTDATVRETSSDARNLVITGVVRAPDEFDQVGTFYRTTSQLEPTATFASLKIDPEYRGQGIGHRFWARSVENLAALGFTQVNTFAVSASGDGPTSNGAYTWARAGYDWRPGLDGPRQVAQTLRAGADNLSMDALDDGAEQADVDALLAMADRLGALGDTFPFDPDAIPDDFPSPNDVAMLGWTEGADTWVGKRALLGELTPGEAVAWDGTLRLTDRLDDPPAFDPLPEELAEFLPKRGSKVRPEMVAEAWEVAQRDPDDLVAIEAAIDPEAVQSWRVPYGSLGTGGNWTLAEVLAHNAMRLQTEVPLTRDNLGVNGYPSPEQIREHDPELADWMQLGEPDGSMEKFTKQKVAVQRSVLGKLFKDPEPDPVGIRWLRMHRRAAQRELALRGGQARVHRANTQGGDDPLITKGRSGVTSWTTDTQVAEGYGTNLASMVIGPDQILAWDSYGIMASTGRWDFNGHDVTPLEGKEVLVLESPEVARRLDEGIFPLNPYWEPEVPTGPPSTREGYDESWDPNAKLSTAPAVAAEAAAGRPLWSHRRPAATSSEVARAVVEDLIVREERKLAELESLDNAELVGTVGNPLAIALWSERTGRAVPGSQEMLGVARRDPKHVAKVYGRWKQRLEGKGTNDNRRRGRIVDDDIPQERFLRSAWDDLLADERVASTLDRLGIPMPTLLLTAAGQNGMDDAAATYTNNAIWFRTRDRFGQDPAWLNGEGEIRAGRSTVAMTAEGIYRHELGHHVHHKLNGDSSPRESAETAEMREWRRRWDAYHAAYEREWDSIGPNQGADFDYQKIERRQDLGARQVSYYSHENHLEGFAEAFTAVLYDVDRSGLSPEALDLLEFMDAVVDGGPIPTGPTGGAA